MKTTRKARRLISSAVAATLAVTVVPVAAAQADRDEVCADAERDVFADVAPGNVHAANIDCVAAHRITVGVGGGNYDPLGTVSRGQMASFLVNFHDVAIDTSQPVPSEASRFTDISGTTHADNIRVADDLTITSGRTSTTYAPSERVSRGQMATFVTQLLRAAGAELGTTAPDRFVDDAGSLHEANIDTLAAVGVVSGVGGDDYDPSGTVTRAQMATFLANAAGLLSDQGHWLADALPVDRPEIVLVARFGTASDVLDVRWDGEVTNSATGSEFEVVADAGTEVIARGEAVATPSGDLMRVTFDRQLAPADLYWLEVAEGVATDITGHANLEQRIAFPFSQAGAGGSDSGGEDDGNEVLAPSIESVATEPSTSQLLITFSEPVLCPTTPEAVAAWSFTDLSVEEDGTHPSRTPDAVVAATTATSTCALAYSDPGIENGDFGLLSYTQPVALVDQVRTPVDVALPTVSDVRVSDSVAPTLETVEAFDGSDVVRLAFSEPMACATVSESQFSITVDESSVTVLEFGCAAPASPYVTVLTSEFVSEGQKVTVTIAEDTTLSDQSLDNQAAFQTRTGIAL